MAEGIVVFRFPRDNETAMFRELLPLLLALSVPAVGLPQAVHIGFVVLPYASLSVAPFEEPAGRAVPWLAEVGASVEGVALPTVALDVRVRSNVGWALVARIDCGRTPLPLWGEARLGIGGGTEEHLVLGCDYALLAVGERGEHDISVLLDFERFAGVLSPDRFELAIELRLVAGIE